MKTLYLLTIVILTAITSSYFTTKRYDETLKQRVYTMWGEGDFGEGIYWYLSTGDSSTEYFVDHIVGHEGDSL